MNESLSIHAILERLGYSASPYFEATESANSIKGILGVYRYPTSADSTLEDRPAVYIAEADDDSKAREIHRKLWNQGDCPFLFIFLPTELLVYSGFTFPTARDEEREPLFQAIQRTAEEIDTALQNQSLLQGFTSHSIDTGHTWGHWGTKLLASKRVDHDLLRNLKALSAQLQAGNFGLTQRTAHAIIGKYIYFRYLADRDILTDGWLQENNIVASDVFGRDASSQGFVQLSELLQRTFNGDIFPVDSIANLPDSAVRFVASVFNGDDPLSGQQSLFDATVFKVYLFDFIPVELLSSIYEQFLHEQNVIDEKDRGGGSGAFYTPKSVADYVISELQSECPLTTNTTVLDPSCGSGVFLVLAYQRLIALHKSEKGSDLNREELSSILTSSIFGIEINEEACGITEFSLLLALMSNLEPRDFQQNQGFKLPKLRGNNIFRCDFFEESPVFTSSLRFRWIAGNPPWFRVPTKKPANLERAAEWETFEAWLKDAQKRGRVIGDRRTCEAFCWRASDLLTDDGCLALLIHATTLVNARSSGFRKRFFSDQYVRRITNFSNMTAHLWDSSNAPGAVIVYRPSDDSVVRGPIIHFAPFVVNQTALQHTPKSDGAWVIAINKDEIQWVQYDDALADEVSLWKICLWGTYHDRRTLLRLGRLFPTTLDAIVSDGTSRGTWCFAKGIEMQDASKADGKIVTYQPVFEEQSVIDMIALNRVSPRPRFSLPSDLLRSLHPDECYMRRGEAALPTIKAPHVIINASFALYSDQDFIIPSPQVGLSAEPESRNVLKAIALFLNSSISRYMLFFRSAIWGVSVDFLNPSDIKTAPFPELTDAQTEDLASEFDKLAELETEFYRDRSRKREADNFELSDPLQSLSPAYNAQDEIDGAVARILCIPSWMTIVAREFMDIRYQLKKGKVEETGKQGQRSGADYSPIAIPSHGQLKQYGEMLRDELNEFARVHHKVSIAKAAGSIIASVEITEDSLSSGPSRNVEVIESLSGSAASFLRSVQERRSQWIYVQRSVKYFDGETRVHLIKQSRLLDWTRTQAFLDAGDIIGSVLAGGK